MKVSAKEKRLLKLYNLSQSERDIMEKEQSAACKICGKVPENGLHVDHSHAVEKWKVKTSRILLSQSWEAYVLESDDFWGLGKTKGEAIQSLKKQLKRASIRGLLCYPCNTSLGKLNRKGRENPTWLRSAAKYLEDFDATLNNPKE